MDPTGRDDDGYLETHQFGRERGEAIQFSVGKSLLNAMFIPST